MVTDVEACAYLAAGGDRYPLIITLRPALKNNKQENAQNKKRNRRGTKEQIEEYTNLLWQGLQRIEQQQPVERTLAQAAELKLQSAKEAFGEAPTDKQQSYISDQALQMYEKRRQARLDHNEEVEESSHDEFRRRLKKRPNQEWLC